MQKIRINFVDFWKGFDKNNNYFINMLYGLYGKNNIEICKKPDYLFYSCFGYENLKYDCIKIFYTGENIVPDFNLCDYALGINELYFGDRYEWFPFYIQDGYKKAYELANRIKRCTHNKSGFCCYVVSNALGNPMRKKLIDALNNYKEVASGGRYRNNVGGPVKDKLKFQKNYKFNLCMENSSTPGYVTEKLIEGFASGGIPIYWGDPNIGQIFNEKSFINCMRYNSVDDIVKDIIKLDQNDELYQKMISEPIFIKESRGEKKNAEDNIRRFVLNIFEQDIQNARRLNNTYIGYRYMKRMKRFEPAFQTYRFFERVFGFYENLKKRHD